MTDVYNDTALQILEAAKQLFAEQGFKAASTKKIAQTAQVNEVTLFRLFGSKAKLFDAVIEHFLFRPNFKLLLEEEADSLRAFLNRLGHFLNTIMSQNATLIKMELRNQDRMMGKRGLSRFPNQVKDLLTQQFVAFKQLSLQAAELEAVCFMTALHGLCFNLYIFQTVTKGVQFEDCLSLLVSKFDVSNE